MTDLEDVALPSYQTGVWQIGGVPLPYLFERTIAYSVSTKLWSPVCEFGLFAASKQDIKLGNHEIPGDRLIMV